MSKNVSRFDRGTLNRPERLDNGWVRVDGYIARTGMLEYLRADGSTWVEYRPEDEAFAGASLDSFSLVPLTNNHPPTGLLDADNTKLFQVGTVGQAARDGDKVRANIVVTDADTIAAMENGKVELSCGYLCDLDMTPGEVEGRRYDAIQRNVRGNHVALVSAGRAGPEVRIRMDSANAEVIPSTPKETMQKINLDGVEYEVSETAAQAFEKHEKAQGEAVAEVQAELEKAKARGDAAEAEVAKLKTELQEAPVKVKAALEARVALEAKAKELAGIEKFDGVSDLDLMKQVAETVLSLKMDGKSDAYVVASFDLAVDRGPKENPALMEVRAISTVKHTDGSDPVEAARARFLEASRNAHKPSSKERK